MTKSYTTKLLRTTYEFTFHDLERLAMANTNLVGDVAREWDEDGDGRPRLRLIVDVPEIEPTP